MESLSAELITPRLRLARFAQSDADALFSIRGDARAMRFWDWPGDKTANETRAVASSIIDEMTAGTAAYWTARTPDGAFIGVFDLSELDTLRPDLGFMVRRDLWGRGYGKEAAGALVGEAVRCGVRGLKARIHHGNTASERLLIGLGFTCRSSDVAVEVMPGRTIACDFFELDLPAAL